MRLIRSVAVAVMLCAASAAFAVPTLPTFNPADFDGSSSVSDHPYFPLQPGTLYTYQGVNDEGETERIEVFVTFQTIDILGVQARVVRDTGFIDGVVDEVTDDYFAQDNFGNVWYLGEDSTDPGSWLAGVNGAEPGFIMKANPVVGDNYFQEHAPNDGALDQATVISLDETVTIGLGTFSPVWKIFESTELDPQSRENKFYAQGLGLILIEEALDEQGEPEFTIELISVEQVEPGAVPEPLTSSLAGLAGIAVVRAITRRFRPQA